jgi:hypothetical protein
MASIEKDLFGRYVVREGDKVHGRYRTLEMAEYRLRQLAVSRNAVKKPKATK